MDALSVEFAIETCKFLKVCLAQIRVHDKNTRECERTVNLTLRKLYSHNPITEPGLQRELVSYVNSAYYRVSDHCVMLKSLLTLLYITLEYAKSPYYDVEQALINVLNLCVKNTYILKESADIAQKNLRKG